MELSQTLVPFLNVGAGYNIEKLQLALRKYEKSMMERVRPEMHVSYEMTERFYAPDAAREFAKFFQKMAAGGSPPE